jgi:hypothetical protein
MHTEYKEPPTHEQIERRAYQIYLEHGFHPGNDFADWLEAEKELTELTESGSENKSPAVLGKYATAYTSWTPRLRCTKVNRQGSPSRCRDLLICSM